MLLEKIGYVVETVNISGRTTPVVHAVVNCYAPTIQILSHLLTCKLLKSRSFFTSKTIFCDFSANKTIKYTLMFK